MKTFLCAALVFASSFIVASVAVADPPLQSPVSVTLGPKYFRDGDVIEINDVLATSGKLEQGDSVTVRGRVRLGSRKSGVLSLYVTQTESDATTETDASQSKEISAGLANFELKATIKHKGYLHLSFYDKQTGKGFGCVYFGTSGQMQEIAAWDLRYHQAD
jgi:hypothetical protein